MQALLLIVYVVVAVAVWIALWVAVLKRPSEPRVLARLTLMSALWLPGLVAALLAGGYFLAVPPRAKWKQTS